MYNEIVFNSDNLVIKHFKNQSSYIRECYIYNNVNNMQDLIIQNVITSQDNTLLIPFITTDNRPISHQVTGEILGLFHSTVYNEEFILLDIPQEKKFVKEKLKLLYEEYKEDKIIQKAIEQALSVCNQLVLCHGDFSSRNIIIDTSGRYYIIDFEAVTLGPRAFDISKYIWKSTEDFPETFNKFDFIKAYEKKAGCSVPQWEIDVYMLVHALLALKWLKATGIEDDDYKKLAEKTIKQQKNILSTQ